MTYDLDYFITKFSAITEDKWITGKYTDGDCHCAYGHCGMTHMVRDTKESYALFNIDISAKESITRINDGLSDAELAFGTTPKQRVVNYLKSLRDA